MGLKIQLYSYKDLVSENAINIAKQITKAYRSPRHALCRTEQTELMSQYRQSPSHAKAA
jgi:hypothetical protein